MTKVFTCDILVSEETVAGLTHEFPMQREKPHTLKGYAKPVTVYQLL